MRWIVPIWGNTWVDLRLIRLTGGEGIDEGYLDLEHEITNRDEVNTNPPTSERGDGDTAEKTITDNSNATPSPNKQRGKYYHHVLDSGDRDETGKLYQTMVVKVRGNEGNKEALVKYSDNSKKYVTFDKIEDKYRE